MPYWDYLRVRRDWLEKRSEATDAIDALTALESIKNAAIGEREQQIEDFEKAGKKIETSNPFIGKL